MKTNLYNKLHKSILVIFLGISFVAFNTNAGELNFGGFSELSFRAMDTTGDNGNTFSQGGIDLYMTKTIGPKTNILAEVVFEISGENEAILDPERIWIQHEISPWLKVKAGRVHTALGYWNETFHHGSWLQTTATRPFIFNFEDDGGILPVHSIGYELRGSGEMGAGTLEYVVNIGNGRGVTADPPQAGQDADTDKSVTALVRYTTGNLTVGLVYGSDKVAGTGDFDGDGTDSGAVDNRNGFDEVITGGHLVWDDSKTQVIFEGFSIAHNYEADLATAAGVEGDTTTTAYYLQASHNLGNKWTPYARYGVIAGDEDQADHYLGIAADNEKKRTTVGARYDLTYTSALKYEYTSETENDSDAVVTYNLNWSYAW